MLEEDIVNNCLSLPNANIMLAVLLMRCMQKRQALKREVGIYRGGIRCCRTCMGRDNLGPLFVEDSNGVSEHLLKASGLHIRKDDGLPQFICANCAKALQNAIQFRKMCIKTERTLLSLGFQKPNSAQEVARDEQRLRIRNYTTKRKEKLERKSIKKRKRLGKKCKVKEVETKYHIDDIVYDDALDYDAGYEEKSDEKADLDDIYHKDPNELTGVRKKYDVYVPESLKCDVCERVLKNKHTYLRHMVVHTGEYPYMCEHCGKGLMARTHLISHMKANHGLERTDKCSYCGYLALNKSILEIHERRHTGEKPFVCDHCGMGFHRRANLLQHLPVHLTEKTAQCSLCPSAFKSVRFLRTHYNKKHKQKKYTYVCPVCKNYFKTTGNVRMHLFRIHGIPKEEQGPVHRVLIADTYMMRDV